MNLAEREDFNIKEDLSNGAFYAFDGRFKITPEFAIALRLYGTSLYDILKNIKINLDVYEQRWEILDIDVKISKMPECHEKKDIWRIDLIFTTKDAKMWNIIYSSTLKDRHLGCQGCDLCLDNP